MTTPSLARLLLLAAIWGASFMFLRIAAPMLPAIPLATGRLAVAALFLAGVALALRRPLPLRGHGRHYLVLGTLNSAVPFALLAYAAVSLPVSLLAVLNATAPLWAAVIGALWLRHRPGASVFAGLLLGVAGVALLVGLDPAGGVPENRLAIGAALAAACCYATATTYTKAAPRASDPFANAHGSLWAATAVSLPMLAVSPLPQSVAPAAAIAVLALGVLCTGVAYLLYFRLVRDEGPTSALTVTFLIPVFGMLWGAIFLGEPIGWHTVAGTATVFAGTALVTGLAPRWVRMARGER